MPGFGCVAAGCRFNCQRKTTAQEKREEGDGHGGLALDTDGLGGGEGPLLSSEKLKHLLHRLLQEGKKALRALGLFNEAAK